MPYDLISVQRTFYFFHQIVLVILKEAIISFDLYKSLLLENQNQDVVNIPCKILYLAYMIIYIICVCVCVCVQTYVYILFFCM